MDKGADIFEMVKYGSIQELQDIVENDKAVLTEKDSKGKSIIHYASVYGRMDVLTSAYQLGANMTELTDSRKSALHYSCKYGFLGITKYLMYHFPNLVRQRSSDGCKCLHHAAGSGHVHILKYLIETEVDPLETTEDGRTILHIACEKGQKEVIEYLRHVGGIEKYDRRCKRGWSAVHYCAKRGDPKIMKFLCEEGVNARELTHANETILHLACQYGHEYLVQFIMEHFENLADKIAANELNVLHHVALGGNLNIFRFFQTKWSKYTSFVQANDSLGRTVLHLAVISRNMELFLYLLNNFPIFTASADRFGFLPIHTAASNGCIDILSKMSNMCVSHFFYFPGFINFPPNNYKPLVYCKSNGYELTVLHIAILQKNLKLVNYLVENYPNLIAMAHNFNFGYLPIHSATAVGDFNIFIRILEGGKDYIQKETITGKNALHIAVSHEHIEITRFLLTSYKEFSSKEDGFGRLPIHLAAERGNAEIIRLFLECGHDFTRPNMKGDYFWHILFSKHSCGQNLLEEIIIHAGIRALFQTNFRGFSLFHVICMNGDEELVKFMMAKFPFVVLAKDKRGYSALHLVAEVGDIKTLELLLSMGLDPFEKTSDGLTLLHVTFKDRKHIQMCKHVSSKFPQMINSAEKKHGLTACHLIAKAGTVQVLEHLESYGGDLTKVTKKGDTALHLACNEMNEETAKYLISNYPGLLEVPNDNGTIPKNLVIKDKVLVHSYFALGISSETVSNFHLQVSCLGFLNILMTLICFLFFHTDCILMINFEVSLIFLSVSAMLCHTFSNVFSKINLIILQRNLLKTCIEYVVKISIAFAFALILVILNIMMLYTPFIIILILLVFDSLTR